jgi:DNA-binding SARP family transcriptional activator
VTRARAARSASPILRVRLFGGLAIERDDWSAPAPLSPAAEALFAHLILERRRSHARDALAGLFWGDMPDDRARNCLNTALWRIRRVLEPDPGTRGTYVETTPSGDVRFNTASDFWLDVAVFEDVLDELLAVQAEDLREDDIRRLESAVDLYAGDLLARVFDDWVLVERERLRARWVDAQVHLMRAYRTHGAWQESLAHARRVIGIDPLREEVHRELMSLYFESGQPAQAVRQYELCREILLRELGIAPAPATQALRARLGPPDASPPPAQPVTSELRLALELLNRARLALLDAERRLAEALNAVDGSRDSAAPAPVALPVREIGAGDRAAMRR